MPMPSPPPSPPRRPLPPQGRRRRGGVQVQVQQRSSPSRRRMRLNLFLLLWIIVLVLALEIYVFRLVVVDDLTDGDTDAVSDILLGEDSRLRHFLGRPRPKKTATTATATEEKPVVIAYAISLVKCGDFQSSSAGLIDAAVVLRHSVHLTSVRNPTNGSRYDYRMYVIVTPQAEKCGAALVDYGYTVLVRDPPVNPKDIKGDYLRKNIHKEWCCGSDEFIKLYAYTLTDHPVVVHTDIDFVMLRPMDELFDAILFDAQSPRGKEARAKIEMDNPTTPMPSNIEAFITRDYHQVIPGRIPAFQAGFLVARPNPRVFDEYVSTIIEGDYVSGFSRQNGWGGLGYGGVVGAMAMQGIGAYYYDVVRNGTSVELNGCRYNHMGANILYEDVPNFIGRYKDLHGKCRNGRGMDCEDCRTTDLALIKNVHYTNCRKPWNCVGTQWKPGMPKPSRDKGLIDSRTADFDHCMGVVRRWHEIRYDLEEKLYGLTGEEEIRTKGRGGTYKEDVFMGHCRDQFDYVEITASGDSLSRVHELYG